MIKAGFYAGRKLLVRDVDAFRREHDGAWIQKTWLDILFSPNTYKLNPSVFLCNATCGHGFIRVDRELRWPTEEAPSAGAIKVQAKDTPRAGGRPMEQTL